MHVAPESVGELAACRDADAGQPPLDDSPDGALLRRDEDLLVDAQLAVAQLGPPKVALREQVRQLLRAWDGMG